MAERKVSERERYFAELEEFGYAPATPALKSYLRYYNQGNVVLFDASKKRGSGGYKPIDFFGARKFRYYYWKGSESEFAEFLIRSFCSLNAFNPNYRMKMAFTKMLKAKGLIDKDATFDFKSYQKDLLPEVSTPYQLRSI